MAWCMHAYVHLLRRRHRGNLTSPAVIDRSGRMLVSRILGGHNVSMAMSGALPISATYTDAARGGTAAADNRKPLTVATNESRSRPSLTGQRSSDSPEGFRLNPGETCNGPPGVIMQTVDRDVTLIVRNRADCHSAAAIISIGEDIITGGGDGEEDGVCRTKISST